MPAKAKPRRKKLPACVRCGCTAEMPIHKFHVEGNPRTHVFVFDPHYWEKRRRQS